MSAQKAVNALTDFLLWMERGWRAKDPLEIEQGWHHVDLPRRLTPARWLEFTERLNAGVRTLALDHGVDTDGRVWVRPEFLVAPQSMPAYVALASAEGWW